MIEIGQVGTGINTVVKPIEGSQEKEIKQACDDFENIFVKMMVDKMWSSAHLFKDDISFESEMWQDTFTARMAAEISQSSSIGIAEAIYSQILKDHISQDNV